MLREPFEGPASRCQHACIWNCLVQGAEQVHHGSLSTSGPVISIRKIYIYFSGLHTIMVRMGCRQVGLGSASGISQPQLHLQQAVQPHSVLTPPCQLPNKPQPLRPSLLHTPYSQQPPNHHTKTPKCNSQGIPSPISSNQAAWGCKAWQPATSTCQIQTMARLGVLLGRPRPHSNSPGAWVVGKPLRMANIHSQAWAA